MKRYKIVCGCKGKEYNKYLRFIRYIGLNPKYKKVVEEKLKNEGPCPDCGEFYD